MTAGDVPAQKRTLRARMRELRNAVTPETRLAAARAASLLFQQPFLMGHQKIAMYWPLPQEMNTLPLLRSCLEIHREVFLPKVHAADGCLTFHRVTDLAGLVRGTYYDILEPPYSAAQIDIAALDLMILPALAIDSAGYRLGMGGGFYDRTLASAAQRPVLLAYVYACQRVMHVPRAEWDIAVDAVLTENEVHFFERNDEGV